MRSELDLRGCRGAVIFAAGKLPYSAFEPAAGLEESTFRATVSQSRWPAWGNLTHARGGGPSYEIQALDYP